MCHDHPSFVGFHLPQTRPTLASRQFITAQPQASVCHIIRRRWPVTFRFRPGNLKILVSSPESLPPQKSILPDKMRGKSRANLSCDRRMDFQKNRNLYYFRPSSRDGQNAHFWGKNAHFLHFLAKWYFIYQKSAFFDIWSYFSLYFPLRKKKATNRGVEWRDFYLAPSMWEVNCSWSRNFCMSYVLNRKMHIFGKKCTFECTFNAHF